MRKMNRVIAVILALVMVISLTAVSALADEKESAGKDIVYTCLGDSIAAGYSASGTASRRATHCPPMWHGSMPDWCRWRDPTARSWPIR